MTRLPLLVCLSIPLCLMSACSSSDAPPPTLPAADASPESSSESGTDADASLPETSAEGGGDAAPDSPAEDAQKAHVFALFTGSDFASKAELVAVNLTTSSISGHLSSDDQDTTAAASGARGFLLHRTVGKVTILDPSNPSVAQSVVDVNPGADAGKPNPYAVVVTAGAQAFVVRYGRNALAILDPASGTLTGEIDLSAFAADGDGLVDAFDGVFDAAKGVVYVGLQRIDQTVFGDPPDYVSACTSTSALLVKIDAATKQVTGTIELQARNPSMLAWDPATRSVVVLGVGCAVTEADGGTSRSGRGIEKVTVDDEKSAWLWQSSALDRPAALVWMGGPYVVGVDDSSFARHWYDQAQQELQGVPQVPVFDGTSIVGVSGNDVVRYDVGAQTISVIASGAFSASGLSAYSGAVIVP